MKNSARLRCGTYVTSWIMWFKFSSTWDLLDICINCTVLSCVMASRLKAPTSGFTNHVYLNPFSACCQWLWKDWVLDQHFLFFAFECLRTQWSSERVVKLKLGGDACTRSHLCFGSLFSRIGPLMQGLQGSAHVTACSDYFVCTFFFINMKYV